LYIEVHTQQHFGDGARKQARGRHGGRVHSRVDDAVAFYKSKAWLDHAPQRDKAVKVIRRYVC
jgi:hypothetical protein